MKKLSIFLALFIGTFQLGMAQAPPPSGSPPSSFVGAPIDSSVWILAICMLLYGFYALRQHAFKSLAVA